MLGNGRKDVESTFVLGLLPLVQFRQPHVMPIRAIIERFSAFLDVDLFASLLVSHAVPGVQIVSDGARLLVAETLLVLDNQTLNLALLDVQLR